MMVSAVVDVPLMLLENLRHGVERRVAEGVAVCPPMAERVAEGGAKSLVPTLKIQVMLVETMTPAYPAGAEPQVRQTAVLVEPVQTGIIFTLGKAAAEAAVRIPVRVA